MRRLYSMAVERGGIIGADGKGSRALENEQPKGGPLLALLSGRRLEVPSGRALISPHGPIHALNRFRMLWASGILMHMSQWALTITLGWLALTLTTRAAVVGPSGKLPRSFPKRAADLPCFDRGATQITCDLWHGYRKLLRDGSEPAFPFGFGLSYTSFAYADLQLERTDVGAADKLAVTVDVPKSGSVAGDEVVLPEVSASSHGSAA